MIKLTSEQLSVITGVAANASTAVRAEKVAAKRDSPKKGTTMAETNGNGRLDNHEERLSKLVTARKEMEAALIVMARFKTKSSAMMKDHAEFLVQMEKRHELRMAEFDDKLNALIHRIGRQQGGIESRR